MVGTLPFWNIIRTKSSVQAALDDPVFTSGILGPVDFAIAITAFTMLVYFKLAPWIAVLMTAVLGAVAYAI